MTETLRGELYIYLNIPPSHIVSKTPLNIIRDEKLLFKKSLREETQKQ